MDINRKTEKILNFLKDKKVGIFCDDSNLYHSYQKYGWRIDFKKLRALLERYCDLKFINYHIAIPAKSDDVFRSTEIFLQKIGPSVTLNMKFLNCFDRVPLEKSLKETVGWFRVTNKK